MQIAWIYRSGVAAATALTLLLGTPLYAADGDTAEIDKRTKSAGAPEDQSGGMSDSAVRVLMTYAFSIIPEEVPGPDDKRVKVDKSDVNKFLLPTDDARRVIRAATRSAYAEICQMPELVQANYLTLIRGEEAKNVWSPDQILMISALHTFSASYFAGGLKITVSEVGEDTPAETAGRATAVSKSDPAPEAPAQSGGETEVIAAPTPKCPPEQKQKVTEAINAYVQAAKAASPAAQSGE